jgi:TonB family protein
MHRRSDPRSPVQSVRDFSLLPFLVFALALACYSTWLQWDMLVDWYDGELEHPVDGARRAKANLAILFSTDDYPTAAIRKEEQGTVAFKLSISRRGTVTECQIANSSGSDALDGATCDILESRAKFEPARDALGKRVADEYSGRIRWELPEE